MQPQGIIQQLFGMYLIPEKRYPQVLPDELSAWYCYTKDGGHSIVVAVKSFYAPGKSVEAFLVPAPVKTVLRGYEQRDGYIIADIAYRSDIGLVVPQGDDEF